MIPLCSIIPPLDTTVCLHYCLYWCWNWLLLFGCSDSLSYCHYSQINYWADSLILYLIKIYDWILLKNSLSPGFCYFAMNTDVFFNIRWTVYKQNVTPQVLQVTDQYWNYLLIYWGFPLMLIKRYIFPRVILYNFFLILLIYGGLGFGVLGLGSYIGFFLGWGYLYKHQGINLGKKWCIHSASSHIQDKI